MYSYICKLRYLRGTGGGVGWCCGRFNDEIVNDARPVRHPAMVCVLLMCSVDIWCCPVCCAEVLARKPRGNKCRNGVRRFSLNVLWLMGRGHVGNEGKSNPPQDAPPLFSFAKLTREDCGPAFDRLARHRVRHVFVGCDGVDVLLLVQVGYENGRFISGFGV